MLKSLKEWMKEYKNLKEKINKLEKENKIAKEIIKKYMKITDCYDGHEDEYLQLITKSEALLNG